MSVSSIPGFVSSHVPIPFLRPKKSEVPTFAVLKDRISAALDSKDSLKKTKGFSRSFEDLNVDQLEELLTMISDKIGSIQDPMKQMDAFAELIPLEKLQDVIRKQYPSFTDALSDAKDKLSIAKAFLEKTKGPVSPTIKSQLFYCLDTLAYVLENILITFGVSELFKPADNEFHGKMKGQKIMTLIYFASFLTTILTAFLAPPLVSLLVGGTLLIIAVLSLIYPKIKPMPGELPQGKNFSRMCRMGELKAVEGRKKTLDEIAKTLIESRSVKKHPLLIGKSGIGKTKTVEAFAKAIERGDYPELKGKQVFYFSTGDLVNQSEMFSSGNNILHKINEAMGRHRENIILVFDEIHEACKEKSETAAMSEQLKTMLDPGPQKFPYVITMTTVEEKEQYIKGAFARRLKPITIENTDPAETLEILNNVLIEEAPEALIEKNVLQYLAEKSRRVFAAHNKEPADSLTILTRCIQYVAKTQKTSLEAKVETVKQQVRGAKTAISANGIFSLPDPVLSANLASLQKSLMTLEALLKKEKKDLKEVFQERDALLAMKKKVCQIFSKTSLSSKDKKELNLAMLFTYVLASSMEQKLIAKAKALGADIVIDKQLVDKAIEEELRTPRDAQRAS